MSEQIAKVRVAVTVSTLAGEIENMVGFERALYLVAWEALSQLAGDIGVEVSAMVAREMAARLDGSGDVR